MFTADGYIIIGTQICDTRTVRCEIYYIHPQSGRTLFVDTLRRGQASASCPVVCNGENRGTDSGGAKDFHLGATAQGV